MNSTPLGPKLKPCPFCGNIPTSYSSDHCPAGKWGAVVCCCIGPEVRTGYQAVGWQEEAANEWNTRHADSAPLTPTDEEHIRLFRQAFPSEEMCCVPKSKYMELVRSATSDGLREAIGYAIARLEDDEFDQALNTLKIARGDYVKDHYPTEESRIAVKQLRDAVNKLQAPIDYADALLRYIEELERRALATPAVEPIKGNADVDELARDLAEGIANLIQPDGTYAMADFTSLISVFLARQAAVPQTVGGE